MKVMKWIFLSLFLGFPAYLALDYAYLHLIADFRFEQFREPEELEAYLKDKYLGKNTAEVIRKFEKAGAKCEFQEGKLKDWIKEYPTLVGRYYCHYVAGAIGINTWQGYQIYIIVDQKNQLLGSHVQIGL